MEIQKAIRDENQELAMKLVRQQDADLGYISDAGESHLAWACFKRMDKLAMLLLHSGQININAIENEEDMDENSGMTALDWALENGSPDEVCFGILHYDGFNLRRHFTAYVLQACVRRRLKILAYLLGQSDDEYPLTPNILRRIITSSLTDEIAMALIKGFRYVNIPFTRVHNLSEMIVTDLAEKGMLRMSDRLIEHALSKGWNHFLMRNLGPGKKISLKKLAKLSPNFKEFLEQNREMYRKPRKNMIPIIEI